MTRFLQAAWFGFGGLLLETIAGSFGLPVPGALLGLTAAAAVHGLRQVRIVLVLVGLILDAVLGRPPLVSVTVFALVCPAGARWLERTDLRHPLPAAAAGLLSGGLYGGAAIIAGRRVWAVPIGEEAVHAALVLMGAAGFGAVLLPLAVRWCDRMRCMLHTDARGSNAF